MVSIHNPILVAAPIQRSGTTLIQRLLNSASNTLIYGESCANDLNMLSALYLNKQTMFGQHDQWRKDQLQNVLAGDVNDWIPDLMPDTKGYLENFERLIANYFQYFADFALTHGRDRWGVKLPGWNVFQLEQILKMMPGAKVVYIVRDLADCVRSAKLMQFCQDLDATRQFGQFWRTNLLEGQKRLDQDNVLWVDYHSLVRQPRILLKTLETFTGAKGIDETVMDHRINDYNRSTLAPLPLTVEETDVIREISRQTSLTIRMY